MIHENPRFPPGPILRGIGDLEEPACCSETALRVHGARVAFADYRLLQHDFPQLRPENLMKVEGGLAAYAGARLERAVREHIDGWLLRNAAFLSVNQAKQTLVNTPVPTTGESVVAFRPPRYGAR